MMTRSSIWGAEAWGEFFWGGYSYAELLGAVSRRIAGIVIINLDFCDREFGTSPCLATGDKCYKTKSTCKYPDAYQNTDGKNYEFTLKKSPIPFPGRTIRPYIVKPLQYLPAEIDPSKALTVNARITIEFYDEPDNDIGIDPYASTRSAYPDAPGTFWTKFLARNLYYRNRSVYIKTGFLGNPEGEFKESRFIIDQIDRGDTIKIVCKDPLKRADRVDVPKATAGKVTDNPLTDSATTINCDDTSEYPSSGWMRIEDEVISYSAKTATSFTGCVRAQKGTTAAEHEYDEKIQLCYVMEDEYAVDIMLDILENEIGYATALVDETGFTSERDSKLLSYIFSCTITKPTKASEILQQLQEQTMSSIRWSEEDQLIKLKAFAPVTPSETSSVSWTDAANIIDVREDGNEDSRISRVVLYYNKDAIGDLKKPESYSGLLVLWDTDAESESEYGEKAIKTIYSQFIRSQTIANALAGKYRNRFRNPAKKLMVQVELKDSEVQLADIVQITTSKVVDTEGAADTKLYQVIKKQQKSIGKFEYTLMDTAWGGKRYIFIAPSGYPNYTSASDAQKKYWFIGDTDNKVNGGLEDGYYIQ